jgi:hypothetical protein
MEMERAHQRSCNLENLKTDQTMLQNMTQLTDTKPLLSLRHQENKRGRNPKTQQEGQSSVECTWFLLCTTHQIFINARIISQDPLLLLLLSWLIMTKQTNNSFSFTLYEPLPSNCCIFISGNLLQTVSCSLIKTDKWDYNPRKPNAMLNIPQ